MRKKLFTFLLALVTSVGLSYAAPNDSGECGANVTYSFNGATGAMTITGTGPMTDFANKSDAPWDSYRTSITSVTITDGVTSVGKSSFGQCTSLTTVTIGNDVETIGEWAFNDCGAQFTSLTLGNSIRTIGNYAFLFGTGITGFTLPSTLETIGDYAFCQNRAITTLTIPSNVTNIGKLAFYNCNALTSITTEATTPPTLGETVFDKVPTSIPLNVPNGSVAAYKAADQWKAFNIQGYDPAPAPANVCGDGLTWELSEGVLTISYDGVGTGEMYDFGYEYDQNPVNVAPWKENKSEITTVIVGDGVKSIGNYAFNDLGENFTAVTIANSVERIGVFAFTNAKWITEITLPSSLKTIDDQCFAANFKITSITIPSGVTSIGYKAFSYCTGLTSLTCEATTPPTLGSSVFYKIRSNTSSISSIPLYVPSASVTAYEAAAQWNAFDIQGYDPAPATGLQVVEVTSDIYDGWKSNDNPFTVNALPGFQAVTFDEAKEWTGVPTSGTAVLVYRTNGDYARVIQFFDGTISDYDIETDFNQIYENITIFGNRFFYTAGGSTPAVDPAVQNVIDLINAIPNPVVYNQECYNALEAAHNAYVALTEEQRDQVTNYNDYSEAEETYWNLKAANDVITLINAIGDVEYTPECKAKIDAARSAYNNLNLEKKGYVTNYNTLLAAEAAYAALIPVSSTVVWDEAVLATINVENGTENETFTKDDITLTALNGHAYYPDEDDHFLLDGMNDEPFSFSSTSADIVRIEITVSEMMDDTELIDGWQKTATGYRWIGEASSVDFGITLPKVTQIAFYLGNGSTPAPTPNPSGECGAQGDNLLWELNTSTGVLTITGSGAMNDWPDDTNLPWYDNRLDITSVVLPSGITSLGTKAFRGCQNLASINMTENYPAGLTAINQEAFCHTKLTSVIIPESVVTIGQDAFYRSENITDVYCYADPNNLTWTDFWCDDFNKTPAKSTQCHVKDCYLAVYNSKWNTSSQSTDVNVTFVGDLPGDCGGSTPTPTDEQVPTNADPENPSYHYSTFFHSTQNYKLTNDGTQAFIADLSNNDLVLTEIANGTQVIPANTAVILRKTGSADPVVLTPTEENGVSVNPDDNSLEGVDAITAVTSIDGLTTTNCYVLSGTDEYGVGFYRINSENLKAHKAYVKYAGLQTNAPRRMRFVFNQEQTATGMENVQNEETKAQKVMIDGVMYIIRGEHMYDAQGQIVK